MYGQLSRELFQGSKICFNHKADRGIAVEDEEIPESVATDLQTVGSRKTWEGTAIERYWSYITNAYAYYSGKILIYCQEGGGDEEGGEDNNDSEEEEEDGLETGLDRMQDIQ
jgi:hypothetical protein